MAQQAALIQQQADTMRRRFDMCMNTSLTAGGVAARLWLLPATVLAVGTIALGGTLTAPTANATAVEDSCNQNGGDYVDAGNGIEYCCWHFSDGSTDCNTYINGTFTGTVHTPQSGGPKGSSPPRPPLNEPHPGAPPPARGPA
ncbi:hypothetical protein [Mycobacterium noviomagense]|nr:hypothetical protein [Mycobacterium noviomagense]